MKFLKVYSRDKTLLQNISNFEYSNLSETWVNKITISWNPKEFVEKIVEIYDHKEAKVSWIVKWYSFNKESNEGTMTIFPLLYDLKQDFITDTWLTPPGDKIFYISDTIENVLDEILSQYISKVANPILSKGNFATTWKSFTYTFEYVSLFDALQVVQNKMLERWFYIKVDIDWKVNLVNIPWVVDLKYLKDVKHVDFEERFDENIKKIVFDNKREATDPLRIFKEYTNAAISIWRVMKISDSRFTDETSVDEYIANIFEKDWSWIVEVKNIISEVDVPLYSKVNLYNWEKNFWEIYVVEKEYLSDGTYNLKLWNKIKFDSSSMQDQLASMDSSITNLYESLWDAIPWYIQETYIDSVQIRSPLIAWNDWLFSWLMKVWVDWIVIDGPNKKIFSQNYSLVNKTWFWMWADWSFLFGKDSNNYFQFDWTNFIFSWKITATSGSSIAFDYVSWANKPANNATVGADWNSNLSNIPSNITNPDYIKSTYIDSTTIQSPYIAGNNGYFSGLFQVWSSWIIIDWVNKNIRSSNYVAWSSWYIIKNDWTIEAQNGIFRGTINATSWNLTWAFRVQSPWYIEVYANANNKILMWVTWSSAPAIQYVNNWVFVWDIVWEQWKQITVAWQTFTINCISLSYSLYVGTDLIVWDDLVVSDDFYLWGEVASDLVMWGAADIVFSSTSNRIYDSTKTYYLYFNGTNWIVKDAAWTHTL